MATPPPERLAAIERAAKDLRFTMSSDDRLGPLLTTLAASRPGGRLLELGTGLGLSLAWLVQGMTADTTIVSLDNDPRLTNVASELFADDERVRIVTADGGSWLETYDGPAFDFIFADTWPGKYTHLEEALARLRPGGLYLIDDMHPQPNWPEGHHERAQQLLATLRRHPDLYLTELDVATGLVLAAKSA
ncbi:O-methyltransferase [Lewinella sp. IMCC34183]|uniref:O-methyltransferase n=1 Tax=Lewinella sp. IMCC34183 TaxID=2248762 RepID=UPI000E27A876|nr:class I SAM-dependent methyltransferase [Lewinella sp. IMCC34183]